jgi:hypothetical protein
MLIHVAGVIFNSEKFVACYKVDVGPYGAAHRNYVLVVEDCPKLYLDYKDYAHLEISLERAFEVKDHVDETDK